VRLEAEAMLIILRLCRRGDWTLVGSDVVYLEVGKIKSPKKKEKVIEYCGIAKEYIIVDDTVAQRAAELQSFGFKLFDSLHIALAEEAKADVLISTDDKMVNLANRLSLKVKVVNPINWISEVL
jgi:predicted nucleic acid-binding protein